MVDFTKMTVAELRKEAKELGIPGFSVMKKAELVGVLKVAHAERSEDALKKRPKDEPKAGKVAKDKTAVKPKPVKKKAKAAEPKEPAAVDDAAELEQEPVVDAPASVREVTASKYNLVVAPSIPEEHLGLLPESYGQDRLVLVPKDPNWMFLYWELAGESSKRAWATLPDGKLVLRLYVEQEKGAPELTEQEVDAGWKRTYIRTRDGDHSVAAELRLKGPGGVFVSMVRSERIPVPVARIRPGAPKFTVVPFNISLRKLREQGYVSGGSYVDLHGRVIDEDEFARLVKQSVPGSKYR